MKPLGRKTVLVTGAGGFIGRNLIAQLRCRKGVRLFEYDLGSAEDDLVRWSAQADVIFHLAGVNRPQDPEEFERGNAGFTRRLCELLRKAGRSPQIIVSSSVQAAEDNPYGKSKQRAEEALREFRAERGSAVAVFRLRNVFGKWCRPNYNSVVATFCHNIAHDLPIHVSDASRTLELVYIDDVIAALLEEMDAPQQRADVLVSPDPIPSYSLTLSDLAGRIQAFHEVQRSLVMPDFSLPFNRYLYATYLSHVDPADWEYGLDISSDSRGSLAEFVKSPSFGQVFVSRTQPGITRGNHYHHTKTEKFLVVGGEGLIRLRQLESTQVHDFHVRGEDFRVVEIPPGHTHSITNIGKEEMVTLFWASEIFDPDRPDTYFLPVEPSGQAGPDLVGRNEASDRRLSRKATR